MENLTFVLDENVPLVSHNNKDSYDDHDDDYNHCNTPNISRVEQTIFAVTSFDNKIPTSTLWLR